jgi:hypothetical protein
VFPLEADLVVSGHEHKGKEQDTHVMFKHYPNELNT